MIPDNKNSGENTMYQPEEPVLSNEQPAAASRFGLSGSTLKLIAMLSMLIDHFGAVIVGPYTDSVLETAGYEAVRRLTECYDLLRDIGRFAFPIFCFLLIEGFLHTGNVWRYAGRLLLFAVISEVPFDLAFRDGIFDIGSQNVFFTLLIGLLMLIGLKAIKDRIQLPMFVKALLSLLTIAASMLAAYYLKTDYSFIGVFSIAVIYLFKRNRIGQAIAGAVSFCWELPAPLAFIPVYLYNGKRGWKMKYIFYLFYPLHLLILSMAAMLII